MKPYLKIEQPVYQTGTCDHKIACIKWHMIGTREKCHIQKHKKSKFSKFAFWLHILQEQKGTNLKFKPWTARKARKKKEGRKVLSGQVRHVDAKNHTKSKL